MSFRMRKGRGSFSVGKRGVRAGYRLGCLLPVVVALVLLVTACGGSQTITGSFVLTDDEVVWSTTSCSGTGGYRDIREGADVVVKDGAGTIVGTGSLVDDPAGSSTSRCRYTFEVPVKDADFYAVEVSRRGALTYSKTEIEAQGWTVEFTLGE